MGIHYSQACSSYSTSKTYTAEEMSPNNNYINCRILIADATQVTCDRQSVCPGDTVTCVCITGNSTSLAWMSNGTRLIFASNDTLLTRRVVPGSSTFAVLTENSHVNGIRVMMSNITVTVSSNDPEIILTCENVDHTITEPIIVPTTRIGKCCVRNT